MNPFRLLAALILALGLSVMGYCIGDGLRHIKPSDRAVTVRGLAEREVEMDTFAGLRRPFERVLHRGDVVRSDTTGLQLRE